jgi:hypothetical protein
MPSISIPIIDQLVHPSIGLLTETAWTGNPQTGPFVAQAPPQNPLVALTYGVKFRIHTVGAFHGRDVSFPVQYKPPLGKFSVTYQNLSGLAIIADVTDITYDAQSVFWEEPLPFLVTFYFAPDVSMDLFWLQT